MPATDKLRDLLKSTSDLPTNFGSTYSVTLHHPIDVVFEKLGKGETLEASVRLSDLCQNFELLESDSVNVPGELLDTTCRLLPPATKDQGGRTLPRQFFLLEEGISMLFGAYKHTTKIFGCLTSDAKAYTALYESVADAGVYVHKTRRFVKVGDNETRVEEEIKGHCSKWLQFIVDKETKRSHRAHLDQYHTLF